MAVDAAEGIFMAGDEHDVIHLSDRAVGRAPVLLVPVALSVGAPTPSTTGGSVLRHHARSARSTSVDPIISAAIEGAAKQHRVASELIRAVIATESAYGARAVSPRGAIGLMQLMPATALGLGVTDAFDPRQNIDAGTRHLRSLLDRFGDNTALALAAYNAGAGAVERHGNRIPPFDETLAYVPRVLRHLNASPGSSPQDAFSHSP